MVTETEGASMRDERPHRRLVYRHGVLIRVTHWINLVCMTILLMSGLQIFNAHPALYWGDKSVFAAPILTMGEGKNAAGQPIGITQIFGHDFTTTGVLGLSRGEDGQMIERGFPEWATIPGPQWLAMGRTWHFFFAWIFVINGAIYLAATIFGRHLRRDLVPSGAELRHIGRSIWDHLRLRFPKERRYNVLQKLSYLFVIFVLAPVIVATGLTMSPRIDAGYPFLLTLFGGRQSARTIHFICAFSFLGFAAIHIAMVLVSGVWNNLRSMVTGRYAIREEDGSHGKE
ncbi:MAG: cytochrome b/b6 domain-containing protein [Stellaceae bacterium]